MISSKELWKQRRSRNPESTNEVAVVSLSVSKTHSTLMHQKAKKKGLRRMEINQLNHAIRVVDRSGQS